jgi:hypothetical protein
MIRYNFKRDCWNLMTIGTEFGMMSINDVFDGMNVDITVYSYNVIKNYYDGYSYFYLSIFPDFEFIIRCAIKTNNKVNKSDVLRGLRE